jgi:hypothetical protein
MEYIESSKELVGYKVKIWKRDRFRVRGFTRIVQPGKRGEAGIPRFVEELMADGRLQKLRAASAVPTWELGLGSWDPECPKGGQRYTVCIEETPDTDFSGLAAEHELFSKEIGASEWMCFELDTDREGKRFWKDNPYKMMGPLGYRFHTGEGDYSIGLHFDAFPPGHSESKPAMEFWITVVKS